MNKLPQSVYSSIDLEAASCWAFRLYNVVGMDEFSRADAASFLGFAYADSRFCGIFPSLRLYGLIEQESLGVRKAYSLTIGGRLMAIHALRTRPEIGDEPMTSAGQFYLARRLAEIEADLGAEPSGEENS